MRLSRLLAFALVAGALYYALAVRNPGGPPSIREFDPDRTAALEVAMWQAYYRQEDVKLFVNLITLLREQYRFPWATAARTAFYFARSAAAFEDLRSGYEQVLPDLERGYRIVRDGTGASFDPAAVARAELAWWVARRSPRQNSATAIGALIADEYALLYGLPRMRVMYAASLRAQAAALRDAGGSTADWPEVSRLLAQSYNELHRVVALPVSRLPARSTLLFLLARLDTTPPSYDEAPFAEYSVPCEGFLGELKAKTFQEIGETGAPNYPAAWLPPRAWLAPGQALVMETPFDAGDTDRRWTSDETQPGPVTVGVDAWMCRGNGAKFGPPYDAVARATSARLPPLSPVFLHPCAHGLLLRCAHPAARPLPGLCAGPGRRCDSAASA